MSFDLSLTILQKSPSNLFIYLAEHLFKELDDIKTEEVEWLAWDPDSIILYLSKKGYTINDTIAVDKLLALISFAYRRDIGTADAKAFEKIIHAFNNDPVVVDVIQEPEIEAVYYGVKEMIAVSKALDDYQHRQEATELSFVGEVPGYVASVAYSNNIRVLPQLLSFAQSMLDFLCSNMAYDNYTEGEVEAIKSVVHLVDSVKKDDPKYVLDYYLHIYNNLRYNDKDNTSSLDFKSLLSRYFSIVLYDPTLLAL